MEDALRRCGLDTKPSQAPALPHLDETVNKSAPGVLLSRRSRICVCSERGGGIKFSSRKIHLEVLLHCFLYAQRT